MDEFDSSDSEYEFSDEENNVDVIGSDSDTEIEDVNSDWDSEDDLPLSEQFWRSYKADDPDLTKFPFTATSPGFQIATSDRPINELGYFQLFFTDELLVEIVAETNSYANQKINRPLQQFSIWHTWRDVTLSEMKALIGVILNMALNPKPEIVDYFSEDWLSKMPFFTDVFSRIRFFQIFWMLHLPTNTSQSTPGSKTKYVCNCIVNKCRQYFVPNQKIAIDESTIGFKGRLLWKCYNPQKPTKWGLRVYCLCDSETGYVYCFVVYYGSTTTNELIRPELQFTSRIVLHLIDMLLSSINGSGYQLFTDRFHTSPDLALELHKLNVHITGTVKTNRKNLPNDFKKQKLGKYEIKAFRKGSKVMALSFLDKRVVSMISSCHKPNTEIVTRIIRRGVSETYEKQKVIIDYTKYMGAVDRADHYCGSYAFTRKSVKWWRKLFFWLLEVAIVNSYHLWSIDRKERNLPKIEHLTYRRNLIEQLVKDCRNRSRKRGRPSKMDSEDRLNGKPHFVAKNISKSTKDCAVCSKRKERGGRKETVYFCETCSRKPGLHPGVCFKNYHTNKNYK